MNTGKKLKKKNSSKLLLAILLLGGIINLLGQNIPSHIIYTSKGKKVSYKKVIKSLKSSNIILFGELHNNPISHWLQYEVTNSLNESNSLILGAEMIEADNQSQLDDYLNGKIDNKAFDTLARLWPNYKTDYAPLVDYAKNNKIKFIATNAPRRYARLVFKNGFESLDTLSEKEKTWIAPLPILYDKELPGYQKMLEMMGGHGGDNLPKAQAIKDATMAYFIFKNYKEGEILIHYNGAYHSDNYEGILWYLRKLDNSLIYKSITTVLQKEVNKLEDENKNKADFIICVDENMTTTY